MATKKNQFEALQGNSALPQSQKKASGKGSKQVVEDKPKVPFAFLFACGV